MCFSIASIRSRLLDDVPRLLRILLAKQIGGSLKIVPQTRVRRAQRLLRLSARASSWPAERASRAPSSCSRASDREGATDPSRLRAFRRTRRSSLDSPAKRFRVLRVSSISARRASMSLSDFFCSTTSCSAFSARSRRLQFARSSATVRARPPAPSFDSRTRPRRLETHLERSRALLETLDVLLSRIETTRTPRRFARPFRARSSRARVLELGVETRPQIALLNEARLARLQRTSRS